VKIALQIVERRGGPTDPKIWRAVVVCAIVDGHGSRNELLSTITQASNYLDLPAAAEMCAGGTHWS
jgi:hypothetical protein